jgi:nucleotide-binding universal stress UspA family protein
MAPRAAVVTLVVSKEDSMFETVIWATDGSDFADRALPYAMGLADGQDKKLVAVHAEELIVGRAGGYPVYADDDELEAKIRRQVEDIRAHGVDASLEFVACAAPNAAHVITDVAVDVGADVIVVATRGHGPVAGLLHGSVTQRLLHIAPCPVLVVPDHDRIVSPKRERKEIMARLPRAQGARRATATRRVAL